MIQSKERSENMIVAAFEELRSELLKLREVDEEIDRLTSKLRRLKEERMKDRSKLVKTIRRQERCFDLVLRGIFHESILKLLKKVNIDAFRVSTSLKWVMERVKEMAHMSREWKVGSCEDENGDGKRRRFDDIRKERPERQKAIGDKSALNGRGVVDRTTGDENALNKIMKGGGKEKCISEDSEEKRCIPMFGPNKERMKFFPVWRRENPSRIEIRNDGGEETKTFEIYDPGYYPNPLSEFLRKCA